MEEASEKFRLSLTPSERAGWGCMEQSKSQEQVWFSDRKKRGNLWWFLWGSAFFHVRQPQCSRGAAEPERMRRLQLEKGSPRKTVHGNKAVWGGWGSEPARSDVLQSSSLSSSSCALWWSECAGKCFLPAGLYFIVRAPSAALMPRTDITYLLYRRIWGCRLIQTWYFGVGKEIAL